MKTWRAAMVLVGLLVLLPGCSSTPPAAAPPSRPPTADTAALAGEHNPFGAPKTKSTSLHLQVRERIGYVTAVEDDWKIPAWVSYRLMADYFKPGAPDFPRLARFITDASLPESLQITHDHYTGTGFDRGHMAPHASMQGRTQECVRESYFLSNIAPQTPALNRTIWKNLEDKERAWAREFGTVWVITGAVFSGMEATRRLTPTNHSLAGQVAIPESFFKILVRREGDRVHALAFVMPNRTDRFENDRDFAPWQVKIDDVEAMTALDFLENLPDDVEDALEATKEPIWN
jgi:endonuclease G